MKHISSQIIFFFLIFMPILAQDSITVNIFQNNIILFSSYEQDSIEISENGQSISKMVDLPILEANYNVFAEVEIEKNGENGDPWDRAGNITVLASDNTPIEIIKFMTAYGVPTKHRIDVSNLFSILQGPVQITGHIPSHPDFRGFIVNFKLIYIENNQYKSPEWVKPVFFTNSLERKHIEDNLTEFIIDVPAGLEKVNLLYYTSGHATDGRGADEFETKFNVIYVDGIEVYRFQPWRDDCENFPSNGNYWLSRSGWCPGDFVEPIEINMTPYLTPGKHRIKYIIEDIRGVDNNFNYGYWRVSSFLTGNLGNNPSNLNEILVEKNSDDVVPENTITKHGISFVDENKHLVLSSSKDLIINSTKEGIYFSKDGVKWDSELSFQTKNTNETFFISAEPEGLFNVNIYDQISGVSTNFDLIIQNNYSLLANSWSSDSTSMLFSPNFAFDGDFKTKWSDNSQNLPNILRADYEDEIELNYFVLYHAGSAGEASHLNTIDFDIEYRDLISNNWKTIASVTDNYDTKEGNITSHYLSEPIKTNSVQIKIFWPDVEGEIASIYEFQMFNVPYELLDKITNVQNSNLILTKDFSLQQNFPNPFNPETTISFYLPKISEVKLRVFNIQGELIDVLENGKFGKGDYSVTWHPKNIASGMYFIGLTTEHFSETIKTILLK